MRFVEVEDLAAYLHRELDAESSLANFACDAATAVVAEYIDQNVVHQTETAVLSGDGMSDALFLEQHPVFSIETITFDDGLDTEEEVDAADYTLSSAGIIYYTVDGIATAWPLGTRNITVEFVSGYLGDEDQLEDDDDTPAPSVPPTVSLVALQVAARIYDTGMAESESTGGYSVTYVQGGGSLTSYEKDILAHHRFVA